jgi:hypothetical protein
VPQFYLPDHHDVVIGKLPFEQNKEPTEAEEQVARLVAVQVACKLWVQYLQQAGQLQKLLLHACLLQHKVTHLKTCPLLKKKVI